MNAVSAAPWRMCVAPMLDWTDRHCRYFHRLLTRRARLYTEMVTTGALLHGDQSRHLDFDPAEHPVALQLGGSEPADLAACARLAEVDGVMVGREAYERPWWLASWDARHLGAAAATPTREQIEEAMQDYLRERAGGLPAFAVVRHMLGLWKGEPGARLWRQVFSDPARRTLEPGALFAAASAARRSAATGA